jgi:hypothetical protein
LFPNLEWNGGLPRRRQKKIWERRREGERGAVSDISPPLPTPAKLKVFLTSGPRLYSDAKEAANKLQREGFPIIQDTNPSPAVKIGQAHWDKIRGKCPQLAPHSKLIRHKLRAFRRSPNTT